MAQLDDDLDALFASGNDAPAPQPAPKLGFFGSLLAAPFPKSVVNGYMAAYQALPQQIQDAQTSRALDLQQKRAALGFLLQRRKMLDGLLPQLIGSQGAQDQAQAPTDSAALPQQQSAPDGSTQVSPLTVSAPRSHVDPLAGRRQALAGLAIVDDKPSDAWSILKGDYTAGPGGDLYDRTNGQTNGVRVPVPQVVHDQLVDIGAHGNIGNQYPEPPVKGAVLLFDGQGKPAAWQMLNGTVQAIQSTSQADALGKNAGEAAYAGTIAGAKAAAQAPFQPVQTNVNGVPTTISASQLPGARGGGASPLPQLPSADVAPVGVKAAASGANMKLPQRGAQAPVAPAPAPRPAGTAVPVTPSAPAGIRGVNAADQKRLDEARKMADQQERVASMADDFMKLNKTTRTGPAYDNIEVPIPFAHTHVNINPLPLAQESTNPNFQAMEGITSRAAPLMRPEGSGRIMQQEYQKFLEAFPNVRNLGTANDQLRDQLHNEATNRRAYANFIGDWLAKNGSLTGADAAWAAQQAPAPTGSGKSYRYDPKTGALEPIQ